MNETKSYITGESASKCEPVFGQESLMFENAETGMKIMYPTTQTFYHQPNNVGGTTDVCS